MPLYEYQCPQCSHRFEVLQRLGEGAEGQSCPNCGQTEVQRVFSTFAASVGGNGNSDGAMAMAGGGGCCRGTPT